MGEQLSGPTAAPSGRKIWPGGGHSGNNLNGPPRHHAQAVAEKARDAPRACSSDHAAESPPRNVLGQAARPRGMVREKYAPDRGEIVWIDFDPVRGHEERGRRPAFIVSSHLYNARAGLAVVCPITSRATGYPFEVPFALEAIQGAVLVDHVRSVDWRARNTRRIVKAAAETVVAVREKLSLLITG